MTQQQWRDRKQWIDVRNMSDETCPGFGLLRITGYEYTSGGEGYILQGSKPDAISQSLQVPTMHVCAGPVPIASGSIGRASLDWPTLALHDGSQDGLGPGSPCGPKENSWYIWGNDFGAFTHIAHANQAYNAKSSNSDLAGVHTSLIAPRAAGSIQGARYLFAGIDSGNYAVGANFEFTSRLESGDGTSSDPDTITLSTGPADDVLFYGDAIMEVRASGTIWSPGELTGVSLSLEFEYEDSSGSVNFTDIYGSRRMFTEEDSYASKAATETRENVAFGGLLEVENGSKLRLVNTSSVDVTLWWGLLTITMLKPSVTIESDE